MQYYKMATSMWNTIIDNFVVEMTDSSSQELVEGLYRTKIIMQFLNKFLYVLGYTTVYSSLSLCILNFLN